MTRCSSNVVGGLLAVIAALWTAETRVEALEWPATSLNDSGLTPSQVKLLLRIESLGQTQNRLLSKPLTFGRLIKAELTQQRLGSISNLARLRYEAAAALQTTPTFTNLPPFGETYRYEGIAHLLDDAAIIRVVAPEALRSLLDYEQENGRKLLATLLTSSAFTNSPGAIAHLDSFRRDLAQRVRDLDLPDALRSLTQAEGRRLLDGLARQITSPSFNLNSAVGGTEGSDPLSTARRYLAANQAAGRIGDAVESMLKARSEFANELTQASVEVGKEASGIVNSILEFQQRVNGRRGSTNQDDLAAMAGTFLPEAARLEERARTVGAAVAWVGSVATGKRSDAHLVPFPPTVGLGDFSNWTGRVASGLERLGTEGVGNVREWSAAVDTLKDIGLPPDVVQPLGEVARLGRQGADLFGLVQSLGRGNIMENLGGLAQIGFNPIGPLLSGAFGGVFGGDGAAGSRHKEVMDLLRVHSAKLDQILGNQEEMKRQLDDVQRQLARIERRLEEQHAEVMREIFFLQSSIFAVHKDVRSILRKELEEAMVFLDAAEGAESIGGLDYLIRRYSLQIAASQVALDRLCRPTADHGEIPTAYRATDDQQMVRFHLSTYPLLLRQIARLKGANQAFSEEWMVCGARSTHDLDVKILAHHRDTNPPPISGLQLPQDFLLDPVLVIQISKTVRSFAAYETLWTSGGVGGVQLRFDASEAPARDAIREAQRLHRARLEFLLRVVRTCIAQEVLFSGDILLPMLADRLDDPEVQQLLSPKHEFGLSELRHNLGLYLVHRRQGASVLNAQYALSWNQESDPHWLETLMGRPPTNAAYASLPNSPGKPWPRYWAVSNPSFTLPLATPADVLVGKFRLRPWLADLEAEHSKLMQDLAFFELEQRDPKTAAKVRLAIVLDSL